jgi:hypothetical protein
VAASYAVLGLHPLKVWPAIVARRKALLGGFYAEWWGEEFESLPQRSPCSPSKSPPDTRPERGPKSKRRVASFPRAA